NCASPSQNRQLLRRFFVVSNFGAFLQFSTDRTVASRNHFVAGLNAAFDFHVGVVRDSGRDFDQLRFAFLFQKHNLGQLFALFFLCSLFLLLVDELGIVVAFIALRCLLFFIFDFLWTQIALAGA